MHIASIGRIQQSFVQRVFNWMFFGLLLTSAVAFFLQTNISAIQYFQAHRGLVLILALIELGLVFTLSARVHKMSATTASLLFFTYAALNGVTFSLILFAYTTSSVTSTFAITAGMFGVMAFFGYITRMDLSKIGSILFMLLIGMVLATLVNIFLHNNGLTLVLTYLGVVVFSGLTAYDMQKIKRMGSSDMYYGNKVSNAAILGALALYLDFINLFLVFLRIFGQRE